MEKRYQVFVSSTFLDLQAERQEVMHAILELDCMPSGMELFPASNESQWEFIKKVIDDCDYYILILAGRYGTIGQNGLSYTEMEYRYAQEKGKPSLVFLHRDTGKIIADKTEKSKDGLDKLNQFRSSLGKLAKHWETASDLGSVVSRSLIQMIKAHPAVGWVRANELADRDAMGELLRLRRRVEELEAEIVKNRVSAPKGTEGLSQGENTHEFEYRYESEGGIYGSTVSLSWNEVFASLAPLMINESSERALANKLEGLIREKVLDTAGEDSPFENNTINDWSFSDEDFHTVKIQLRALGLIAKSEQNRSLRDRGTYWTLTPYGDETMIRLRAIRNNQHDDNAGTGETVADNK